MHAENSDVSPVETRVAVAVMVEPATMPAAGKDSANDERPAPSVVTTAEPMNTAPSPNPDGSHDGLAKNSSVNCANGDEFSVPRTATVEPSLAANCSTGKF